MDLENGSTFKVNSNNVIKQDIEIPKQVLYVTLNNIEKDEIYLIEYKGVYIHANGGFAKGINDFNIKKKLDFKEVVSNLDISNNELLDCVLNFYSEVAEDVENNLLCDIHNTDKHELDSLSILDISKPIEFFKYLYESQEDFLRNIDELIRDGLTGLQLSIENYCKNYNTFLNPSDYLKPFSELKSRFGINKDLCKEFKDLDLCKDYMKDFDCVKVCINLKTDKLEKRLYDFSFKRWYPKSSYNVEYLTIGLLSSS